MASYELIDEQHVLPSPAGAYYATSSHQADLARSFLLLLMANKQSQLLTVEKTISMTRSDDLETALQTLHRIQQLGWLETYTTEQKAPEGALEQLLPPLLEKLSINGKVLLADQQGFYLATHGFAHETAEELSALSADLASLRIRHRELLSNNLSLKSEALGVIDAAGNSQLGFWPLYIGKHCFTLVMSDIPHFNQPEFTTLVWALTSRYGADEQPSNEQNNNAGISTEESSTTIHS